MTGDDPRPFGVLSQTQLEQLDNLLLAAMGGDEKAKSPLATSRALIAGVLAGKVTAIVQHDEQFPSIFDPNGSDFEAESVVDAINASGPIVAMHATPADLGLAVVCNSSVLRSGLAAAARDRLGQLLAGYVRKPGGIPPGCVEAMWGTLAQAIYDHYAEDILETLRDENLLPGLQIPVAQAD